MKDILHHLFVPRESNKYRSKLLHYEIILVIIALLVSSLITIAGMKREYPAVLGISTNISVEDLLKNTNEKRQQNGLAPLKLSEKLNVAAQLKAKNMFVNNYWAHVSPDGTTPWVFIKDAGYQYLYAGENLAHGFSTAPDVVDAWMKSPSHRENMLSPNYTDIGFAIDTGSLTGSDTVLVVQMFGSPYDTKPSDETTERVSQVQTPIAQVQPTTIVTPTITPKPTIVVQAHLEEKSGNAGVAAIQNTPLFDSGLLQRNIFFFFIVLFIAVFIIDGIVIERKQIARVFSHNVDHILFLLFMLLVGILIGRGLIL